MIISDEKLHEALQDLAAAEAYQKRSAAPMNSYGAGADWGEVRGMRRVLIALGVLNEELD